MKKFLKRLIILLIGVIVVIGMIKLIGDFILEEKQIAKNVSGRISNADFIKSFTYASPKRISEEETYPVFYEQDLQLKMYSDNILGKTQIQIKNEEGESVYKLEGKDLLIEEKIHLDSGMYKMYIQTGIWGYAKLGFNRTTPDDRYLEVQYKKDSDLDHLTDEREIKEGTNLNNADTDGDGLSDYYEICKYKTNPLNKDSDGDGMVDSDWNERREFTYTIQAVVDLRPPFNEEHMNDFYQDARKIEVLEDDVTCFEFILYPEAEVMVNPKQYIPIESEYTKPTYTKNYSKEIVDDMKKVTYKATTDFQATKEIIQYFYKNTEYVSIDKDLGYATDMPLLFNIYRDKERNIKENFADTSTYSIEEIKERNVFANSMYHYKVHGACGSTAVLKGAMLRAAGLEEKTIFTIPLIFSYDTDHTLIKVKEPYNRGGQNIPSENTTDMRDHYFHEVKIGDQWLRADDMIQLSHKQTLLSDSSGKTPIYVKILELQDPTDYEFGKYWNENTWNQKRAYKYRLVIEQEAKYN